MDCVIQIQIIHGHLGLSKVLLPPQLFLAKMTSKEDIGIQ